uniref:protein-tyrosine-phosphatase n=1 Tax=Romanomermis culicivorax TaxID=13658 RepID=A0A915HRQ3_ROMCU
MPNHQQRDDADSLDEPDLVATRFNFSDKTGYQNVVSTYSTVKDVEQARQHFYEWFNTLKQSKGKVGKDFSNLRADLQNSMKKSCESWKADMKLNRYKDMLCFDDSRVVLKDGLLPDYVHANYVPGYEREKAYIITQAPLPETITEFWRMIWQEKVNTIVMLTHLSEREKPKCERYFPITSASDFKAGIFRINLAKCERRHSCRSTLFRLTNSLTKERRYIAHIGYIGWPDKGVPEKMDTFRKFVNYARLVNVNVARLNSFQFTSRSIRGPPVVIHCSAGIGRSAVYALSDFVLDMFYHSEFKDPLKLVYDMREYRYHAVHTKIQLLFLYNYIVELAQHDRYKFISRLSKDS